MDWKLELVSIPVTDVDRAKAFYVDQAGFTADHDHAVSDELRFVQLTPSGSSCSIALGVGSTTRRRLGERPARCRDVQAAGRAQVERGESAAKWRSSRGLFVFFSDPTATAGRCSSCRPGTSRARGTARTAGPVSCRAEGSERWARG